MVEKKSPGPLIFALLATLCLAIILAPMSSVLLWSIILSVLFGNLNEKWAKNMGGRNKAAFATVGVIMLVAIVPLLILVLLVSGQLVELISNWDSIVAQITLFISNTSSHLPRSLQNDVQHTVNSVDFSSEQIMGILKPALSASFSMGTNIAIFFGILFSTLYVTFFFLRDWRGILGFLSSGIPLSPEQKAVLSKRLSDTMMATVRGVILVAAAQSLVAGVIYALLGIPFYALLAVLTFVACLIPAIGSALVWGPVAIFFLITGQYTEALIMVGSGLFIISMVDNILRPRLIAEKAAMPDFLIFLSSFGGMAVAGFDGLFLGPIVASFFIEAWRIYLGLSGTKPIEGLTPGTEGAPAGSENAGSENAGSENDTASGEA
ncbi:MAG: AI-2E family transporter [Sphingomonadaceae bacterium]